MTRVRKILHKSTGAFKDMSSQIKRPYFCATVYIVRIWLRCHLLSVAQRQCQQTVKRLTAELMSHGRRPVSVARSSVGLYDT